VYTQEFPRLFPFPSPFPPVFHETLSTSSILKKGTWNYIIKEYPHISTAMANEKIWSFLWDAILILENNNNDKDFEIIPQNQTVDDPDTFRSPDMQEPIDQCFAVSLSTSIPLVLALVPLGLLYVAFVQQLISYSFFVLHGPILFSFLSLFWISANIFVDLCLPLKIDLDTIEIYFSLRMMLYILFPQDLEVLVLFLMESLEICLLTSVSISKGMIFQRTLLSLSFILTDQKLLTGSFYDESICLFFIIVTILPKLTSKWFELSIFIMFCSFCSLIIYLTFSPCNGFFHMLLLNANIISIYFVRIKEISYRFQHKTIFIT
jgi:hypothetical protein